MSPLIEFMPDEDLLNLVGSDAAFVIDVECYPNLWHVGCLHVQSGQEVDLSDRNKAKWLMSNFLTIGFNSFNYDLLVIDLWLAGANEASLKQATDEIITGGLRSFQFYKKYSNVQRFCWNHIDLIEVCPLEGSLKVYAARLNAERMAELPYDPATVLTYEQKEHVITYCHNDLVNTRLIYNELRGEIELRTSMSNEYNIDLRSKSDAQIAEAVLKSELAKAGIKAERPELPADYSFKYNVPDYMEFKTPELQHVLEVVRNATFTIDPSTGSPTMPPEIGALDVRIGQGRYRFGLGGLHSCEECQAIEVPTRDIDATSFYPRMIINQKLFPKHIGAIFLKIYTSIVDRRVGAKGEVKRLEKEASTMEDQEPSVWAQFKALLKKATDSMNGLKVTINGGFGKFGSKWSIIYSPDLMIQVTISGQLNLLMFIEALELAGVRVVSANTDGIVMIDGPEVDAVNEWWQKVTSIETEQTFYKAIYSRDVNNYIAVKTDGKVKSKGVYSHHEGGIFRFHKSPDAPICAIAVEKFLAKGVPIAETINNCTDVTKFVTVRSVKGGAVDFHGNYIGKCVRWYIGKNRAVETINYQSTGHKVPRSNGAVPLMNLPENRAIPLDLDKEFYIEQSRSMLYDLGRFKQPHTPNLF
jgi:hypothetical protein